MEVSQKSRDGENNRKTDRVGLRLLTLSLALPDTAVIMYTCCTNLLC